MESNPPMILQRHVDYDTMHPVETLDGFLTFLREVTSRCSQLKAAIDDYDDRGNDLNHYVELSDDMPDEDMTWIYAEMKETRRARRKCKNELEILSPIAEYVAEHPQTINGLQKLFGLLRNTKRTVDNRSYIMRTKILDDVQRNLDTTDQATDEPLPEDRGEVME